MASTFEKEEIPYYRQEQTSSGLTFAMPFDNGSVGCGRVLSDGEEIVKSWMRRVILVLTALLTLPSLGCPTMQPKYVGPPEVIRTLGAYNHQASGLVFPTNSGSFSRVSILRYDSDAMDISAGYNLLTPGMEVAATVYVYPAPRIISIGSPQYVVSSARETLSQREFDLCKKEILEAHPNARIMEDGDFSLAGTLVHSGKRAIFEYQDVFAGRQQPLRSELYLFTYVRKKWIVKYRFTYPKENEVSKQIDGLMLGVPK